MAEATRLARHLNGSEQRTPTEHRARVDELLAKIERDDLLPAWCWAPMTDTLGRLAELGDDLAWLGPAYLSNVLVRGAVMFDRVALQASLLDERQGRPTQPCDRCGADATVSRAVQFSPRLAQLVDCARCGREAVMFDEEPYPGPTLLAKGAV